MDMHSTTQNLEAAGADPRLAAAIAAGIARAALRRGGPSPMSILTTAMVLGFTLVTVVFGWFMFEASQQRSYLRAAIEANRNRIDAVETRLAGDIANLSERMTRIETLLEERLPPRS